MVDIETDEPQRLRPVLEEERSARRHAEELAARELVGLSAAPPTARDLLGQA